MSQEQLGAAAAPQGTNVESAAVPSAAREFPQTAISKALDGVVIQIGNLASWLWVVLLLAIVINVFWRYALRDNIGQLEEAQWHIYSVAFLVGLSYCVVKDSHIRIDIFHNMFPLKAKAWVDFFGILLFGLPFVVLVVWYGVPFTYDSYLIDEVSPQPSGLPLRWLIKGMLVVGFGLLALAMVSRLLRVMALLFGFPRPLSPTTDQPSR